jgi:DNA-binding transcriptional MerR regulator
MNRVTSSAMTNAPSPSGPVPESVGEPIAEVSRILQVPMPTLRSWELRYGIPELARASRRHRRYTAEDIHALRIMRDEISRGRRAAAAAREVRALLGISGPTREVISAILAASDRSDAAAIRAVLTRSADLIGDGPCIDDILLPALRQIGQWWESGRCTVDQEHHTTAAARSWLRERMSHAPAPTGGRSVVLACGPADFHTVGCECLALLLQLERIPARVLGAGVATERLLGTAAASGAAAVVVASHLPTARRRALESITAASSRGLGVFYAGNAFTALKNRRSVPGTYLGDRIQDAAKIVVEALN